MGIAVVSGGYGPRKGCVAYSRVRLDGKERFRFLRLGACRFRACLRLCTVVVVGHPDEMGPNNYKVVSLVLPIRA